MGDAENVAHGPCVAEIDYLRGRVAAADRVFRAALHFGAPTSHDYDGAELVWAVNGYQDFLRLRPDRCPRGSSSQRMRAAPAGHCWSS